MLVFIIELAVLAAIFYYLNNYLRRTFVDKFNEKIVFITGTDTGIGRQVALDLDRQGLTVYAGCYTGSGAESLRKQASAKLKIVELDVIDGSSISKARHYVESTLPPGQGLWALVNNAGIMNGVVFEWSTIEDYENTMDVNFYGIIRMTNAFLPLIKKTRGRIVNVTSIAGRFETMPGPYCCSKFAAESYTNGLRRYASTLDVKVSTVEPGFYPTAMTSTSHVLGDHQRQWMALSDSVKKDNGFNEEYRQKVESQFAKIAGNYLLTSGNTVDQISECIVHAIGSTHPKTRYVCGLDAHLLFRPAATFIPDWLSDFVSGIIHRH